MKKRYFSIVIPLFNKEKEVATTIDSVRKQSYPYFEVLIIDDGSTDNSVAIVEALEDSRIRVVKKENGGVSSARNRGIALAAYNHILFLDADDEWLPEHLFEISKLIEQYPNAGAYATDYWFRDSSSTLRKAKIAFNKHQQSEKDFQFDDYFRVASEGDLPIHSSSICIPAKVLRQLGDFPENEIMGEDQDLWARIALHYPIAFSNTQCVIYNLAADNRACTRIIPKEECPFSKRLTQQLSALTLPMKLKSQILDYTANHLLHIASQNVSVGDHLTALTLLSDDRTKRKPMRRAYWKVIAELGKKLNGLLVRKRQYINQRKHAS